MSFARVAQLDAVAINKSVGKLFADYAVKVVRNFTGARFDIDAEIAAITKTAVNILYVVRFGVTPGAGLFSLYYGERDRSTPPRYMRVRILGCVIVFCFISYLKSRNLLRPITRLSDFIVVINFVAFLINGVYPTIGERLFDLRFFSKSGPGDMNAIAGHHRELLFHLFMNLFDVLNQLNLNNGSTRKWLPNFLEKWFSKKNEKQSSEFSCVICKKTPINALRGGVSILNTEFNISNKFCECFYCHSCFSSQIASDSLFCTSCGKHFAVMSLE